MSAAPAGARPGSIQSPAVKIMVAAFAIALSIGLFRPVDLRASLIDPPPPPELTAPVNDFANVLSPDEEQQLDRLSRALQAASGDVVVVVTVPTVDPYADIREYAVKLFENQGRGIGEKGKDNGLLILLALKERRVWVEVGYGLEGWITDGFAGETSRDYMVPEFRDGRYGAGLINGATRIVGRIAQGRGVTLTGVDVPRQPIPTTGNIPFGVVVALFVGFMLLSRILGGPGSGLRRRGRGWYGGVGPFGGWGGPTRGGGFGGGFGGSGGFGGFGGGRSGGGGGGAGW